MPKHIYLKVEKVDIDDGSAEKPHGAARSRTCPIAQSLKRRFPDCIVDVCHNVAAVGQMSFRLSDPARIFIFFSDRGARVDPATFRLTRLDS